jgi:hypothetical protein
MKSRTLPCWMMMASLGVAVCSVTSWPRADRRSAPKVQKWFRLGQFCTSDIGEPRRLHYPSAAGKTQRNETPEEYVRQEIAKSLCAGIPLREGANRGGVHSQGRKQETARLSVMPLPMVVSTLDWARFTVYVLIGTTASIITTSGSWLPAHRRYGRYTANCRAVSEYRSLEEPRDVSQRVLCATTRPKMFLTRMSHGGSKPDHVGQTIRASALRRSCYNLRATCKLLKSLAEDAVMSEPFSP